MFKTNFDRSPLVITARLVLLLVVLGPLAFGIYSLRNLSLGDRHPALPTPPGARMEPRPTPHEPVLGEIPLIQGKVLRLRFAQARPEAPWEQWVWGSRFAKNEVYYVHTVADIQYPAVTKEYKFPLEYIYYKDSEIFQRGTIEVIVQPAATGHGVVWGYGWNEPGRYPVGQYYVEVLYEGKVVGNGAFEITE